MGQRSPRGDTFCICGTGRPACPPLSKIVDRRRPRLRSIHFWSMLPLRGLISPCILPTLPASHSLASGWAKLSSRLRGSSQFRDERYFYLFELPAPALKLNDALSLQILLFTP